MRCLAIPPAPVPSSPYRVICKEDIHEREAARAL